jgi:hypothetical protein
VTRDALLLVILLASPPGRAAADEAKPAPCGGDAYAKLDFWVGHWEVFDPKGEKQGDNRIEKTLSGCATLEHWRDAGGSESSPTGAPRRSGGRSG